MSTENSVIKNIEDTISKMDEFEKTQLISTEAWTLRIENIFTLDPIYVTLESSVSELTDPNGFFSSNPAGVELQTKIENSLIKNGKYTSKNSRDFFVREYLTCISSVLHSLRVPKIYSNNGDNYYIEIPNCDLKIVDLTKMSDETLLRLVNPYPNAFAIIRNLFGKELHFHEK